MAKRPILVVEDEADIRETLALLLEDEGYPVYAAGNGLEAWEILQDPRRKKPGLIALDFFMPVLDARGFLDLQPALEIPVVLVTAADEKSRAGIAGRTVAVLRKPMDLDAFLALAEKFCG